MKTLGNSRSRLLSSSVASFILALGMAGAGLSTSGTLSPAKADILATIDRDIPQTGGAGSGSLFLDNGGSVALQFKIKKANQKVAVTYNAECRVTGTTSLFSIPFFSVTIFVDGVATKPTSGPDFFLCSAPNSYNGVVRQSFIKTVGAVDSNHNVTINWTAGGTGVSWRVDDASLVVEN